MTNVVDWLRANDMGSDGLSDEAAAFILDNPVLLEDLLAGIDDQVPAVRARTADALEKVGRQRPDLIRPHLPKLVDVTYRDEKAAVKMHLAMIFGHLAVEGELRGDLYEHLLHLLEEPGVSTRAWAIASLCILARLQPTYLPGVLKRIGELGTDSSIAIRTRVRMAVTLLTDPSAPFPPGWVKSHHLIHL
jgi:hypothetical protein